MPNQTSTPVVASPAPRAIPIAHAVSAERTAWYVRAVLLTIGAGLIGVFVAARWISPYDGDGSPRRMATHTQLGLPPCGFAVVTGKPCPACGMTTSFALLAHGDVVASLQANWVGTLLAVFWAGLMVWALASGFGGRLWLVPPGRAEITITIIVGIFLVLMLGRWLGVLLGG